MFRLKTLIILTVLLAMHASMASAASSISRSFKLTVTIPSSVNMSAALKETTAAAQARPQPSQIVQEHRTVRNNSPVTIKSIVVL